MEQEVSQKGQNALQALRDMEEARGLIGEQQDVGFARNWGGIAQYLADT